MRPFHHRLHNHHHPGALHRRLFVWFGVAIGVTALVATMVFGWLGPGGSTFARARAFLSDQFAEAWPEPARRDALAETVAKDFAVHVELFDAGSRSIGSFGVPCRGKGMAVPVRKGAETLGEVRLCEEHRFGSRTFLPFGIVAIVLWGVSGRVARRLLRPLSELARVAGDIGRGHLDSRVRIGHEAMEFWLVGNVMNEMASRIEKQLADQRALLATVSHEIRTPLSRMRLLIEFARGKMSTAGTVEELDQLEREIAEIDALVSDLLASSRIDFSAVNKTRLDAREIGKTVLERAGIDASRLVAAQTASFQGDATLVVRAVQNLVDNAQRHGGGLDRLIIDISPHYVLFGIEDRGSGLAPGEETRIFEPFYQRTTEGGGETGLGLGLALVKRIAEAHEGYVSAKNRTDGDGARVAIAFAR